MKGDHVWKTSSYLICLTGSVTCSLEEFIRGFKGPGAIVWGEKDPILGRVLRRLIELLPDTPVTRTKAGHFIQKEEPAAIARAIIEVYERCTG